jgi:hypothetical protein
LWCGPFGMTAIQPAPVSVETLKGVSAKPHLTQRPRLHTAPSWRAAHRGRAWKGENVPPEQASVGSAASGWRKIGGGPKFGRWASWTRKDVAQAVKAMRAVGSPPRGFSLGNPSPSRCLREPSGAVLGLIRLTPTTPGWSAGRNRHGERPKISSGQK